MLITDKESLQKFSTPYRLWQGIPGIEVTEKGRIFSTFYSGGTKEEKNNFAVLLMSDDGVNFGEPVAVAFKENYRCYDPCLWIDPLKRLWFIWACAPDSAVYAAICDNPDEDTLSWGQVRKIGNDVMMNKPTVLETGEWLFPIAVWNRGVTAGGFHSEKQDNDRKAFAYKTVDNGNTFVKLGGADLHKRSYDEHMIVELSDGRLAMYVRTLYGIGIAHSYDGGKTWTKGQDSGLGGPSSRFFISRLASGRLLLVNHKNFTGRNNLTAMLSEDDGKTFKYSLLLDGRPNVSYPDAKECKDGYIYITYDRERGGFLDSIEKVYNSAREVLYAKITEEDIIRGALVDKGSKLGCVISKLGKYAFESENPFGEICRFSVSELAQRICEKSNDEIVSFLFDHYDINCMNMHEIDNEKLDILIEKLNSDNCEREKTIKCIITLLRSVNGFSDGEEIPVVQRIKDILSNDLNDELSASDMADKLSISVYYMCHVFKKATGITIGEYRKQLKLAKAKYLLVNTDKRIGDISWECGFDDDSYFAKVFKASEKISPLQYRKFGKMSKI